MVTYLLINSLNTCEIEYSYNIINSHTISNIYSNIFLPTSLFVISLFTKSVSQNQSNIYNTNRFNFAKKLNVYQHYIYQPSNLHYVCVNKTTRDFYYHWARNFDEVFFKKICLNNNLLFK